MPKDEEFTFASLIKPGEGAKMAMQRELEKRKAQDDERWKWEPGYVYSGPADLVLQHGEFFSGRQLPDKYERGAEGKCFLNALRLAEADPALRYFQGFYMVGNSACAHAWCVDSEGVVEPTFWTVPNDPETGRKIALLPGPGGRGYVPWVPPQHWAYYGVEFEAQWVRDFIDHSGGEEQGEYSVLDPRRQDSAAHGPAMDDWIFRNPYKVTGVRPLPEYIQPEVPDDEDWYDDEDEDEEPYA